MGVILILAGMLRLGFVADFFGKPVLLGYINGIALTIIAGQLGKMFGLDIDSDDFFPIVRGVRLRARRDERRDAALSAALLVPALLVRRFVRAVPAPVVVLLLGLLRDRCSTSMSSTSPSSARSRRGCRRSGFPMWGSTTMSISCFRRSRSR